MESTDGKSQGEEKSKERRSEKRKSQKKEDADARKGRKVAKHLWLRGRKVGSLKRRVRSQLARWEMKNCTPLWREAHFEAKMYKKHQLRTTFRSCDVEKGHAIAARSTCWSQNLQNTPEKVHAVVARSTFQTDGNGALLNVQMWFGTRKGLRTVPKMSKTLGCCSNCKNDGMRGTFEEDLQRCISPGRRTRRDISLRDVWRSGCWFPARGCILEHQIFRFAKMILRDRCSTSYCWPGCTFSWQMRYFR